MSDLTHPDMPMPDEPVLLDLHALEAVRGLQTPDEPDFLDELIGMFLEDAAAHLLTIHTAVVTEQWETLRNTAHALKGSAANLGARRLAAVCLRLEQAAGDPAQVTGLLDEFEEVLAQTCLALNEF